MHRECKCRPEYAGTPGTFPPEIGKIVVEIWCYLPGVYTGMLWAFCGKKNVNIFEKYFSNTLFRFKK